MMVFPFVEDGLSFNQITSSKFLSVAFGSLGLKHTKSQFRVSVAVSKFIEQMQKSMKEQLKAAYEQGDRFSIVIDEWTSIRSRRYLNVCVVTKSTTTNLGLARCHGSMTAKRTVDLLKV